MGAPLRTGEFYEAGEAQGVRVSSEPFKFGLDPEDYRSDDSKDTDQPAHEDGGHEGGTA